MRFKVLKRHKKDSEQQFKPFLSKLGFVNVGKHWLSKALRKRLCEGEMSSFGVNELTQLGAYGFTV